MQSVNDPDGLYNSMRSHGREFQILIFEPTAGQLAWLAIRGGTGRLEDYGTDSDINHDIHERNLAVCKNVSAVYNLYSRATKRRSRQRRARKSCAPWAPR